MWLSIFLLIKKLSISLFYFTKKFRLKDLKILVKIKLHLTVKKKKIIPCIKFLITRKNNFRVIKKYIKIINILKSVFFITNFFNAINKL